MLPVALSAAFRGTGDIFVQIGLFFGKAACVTFGGAYAVLACIGQQAVHRFAWIEAPQMVDGLALAESTPGPLILVTQFVGFLAAWRHPGDLSPLWAGTAGALMTTWTTFVPCFLWILLGAPHIERSRGNASLAAALAAISAAVVGVIVNLALFFAEQTLLPSGGTEGGGPDLFATIVSGVAFALLARNKLGVIPVILLSAVAGGAWKRFV